MTTTAECPETDFIMQIAWADCLRWAVGDKTVLAQFTVDTGYRVVPPATSPIAKMIDDAAGVNADFPAKFIEWFNQTIWGPPTTAVAGAVPEGAA